MTTDFE